MARPLRINVRGGWYHVMGRGTERRELFVDERGYLRFLELLEEMVLRFRVRLHAYGLMPNHLHLAVETPEANLSAAMQWLKTSYAMWFNRRENRVGPLFQGRFKAILFEGRAAAWPITRYIHLNCVHVQPLDFGTRSQKAEGVGLRTPDRATTRRRREVLKSFRWSSYPGYAGWRPVPEWLTVHAVLVGARRSKLHAQRRAYRAYVESFAGDLAEENPLTKALAGLLYGSRAWIDQVRVRLSGNRLEQKAARALVKRPEWSQIKKTVEEVKGERWATFAERHGDWGRDLALYVGRRHGGMSLKALAEQTGMSSYHAAGQAIRRFSARLARESLRKQAVEEVLKCMFV